MRVVDGFLHSKAVRAAFECLIWLILKRASASRGAGEWNDDDHDVLADGSVAGRIMKVHAAPIGSEKSSGYGCTFSLMSAETLSYGGKR
jgi:hypothetical protein